MDRSRAVKIVVRTARRPDGGLRAWSDDVPGLVLSGSDPDEVIADLKPAIETIMSAMMGCSVVAHELVASPRAARAVSLGAKVRAQLALRLRCPAFTQLEFSAAPHAA